jgi:Ca-activated chloride channel family protein
MNTYRPLSACAFVRGSAAALAAKVVALAMVALTLSSQCPVVFAAGMIEIDPINSSWWNVPSYPRRSGRDRLHGQSRLQGFVTYGLEMQSESVDVTMRDLICKTHVVQIFKNNTSVQQAGIYTFPLPDDAVLTAMALDIDGKMVPGELMEAVSARTTYENIVRRKVDPALVEYIDNNNVRIRIYPIPAFGTKKIELEYTQLLHPKEGRLVYEYPVEEPDESTAESLKISMDIQNSHGLSDVWSPSHSIDVQMAKKTDAKVEYASSDVVANRDFSLYVQPAISMDQPIVMAQKREGTPGFFLASITPPLKFEHVRKQLVLLVDSSASMRGLKLTQVKRALKQIVDNLGDDDSFDVVQFNSVVDNFSPNLIPATVQNKILARNYIDAIAAEGETNVEAGMLAVSRILNASERRDRQVLFVTDGQPTVGETDTDVLLRTCNFGKLTRVFDLGIGDDINWRFLDALAQQHDGISRHVASTDSIEAALKGIYKQVDTLQMDSVKITIDKSGVRDVYPKEPRRIPADEGIVIAGKYDSSGEAVITLTGQANGARRQYAFPIRLPRQVDTNTDVPQMWAMRRIHDLYLLPADKEISDEVIALSRKYPMVSKYTSLISTDPAENRRLGYRGQVQTFGRNNGAPSGLISLNGGSVVVNGSIDASGAGGNGGNISMSVGGNVSISGPVLAAGGGGYLRGFGGTTNTIAASGASGLSLSGSVLSASNGSVTSPSLSIAALPVITNNLSLNGWSNPYARRAEEVTVKRDDGAIEKIIGDRKFVLEDAYWVQSGFGQPHDAPVLIEYGSDRYFKLAAQHPDITKYLALGHQVIFMFNGIWYQIVWHPLLTEVPPSAAWLRGF